MTLQDSYYAAVLARDYRFDGKFFVAVKTTGIYCRPICPARPKRENVEFFSTALAAEKAGYRPCLRCRPESAPGSPAWSGKNASIEIALKLISQNAHRDLNEEAFARKMGMGARHLRRLFQDELGKTPKQVHDNNRLNFARTLLSESHLPVTDVAFASGFASIRRFNAAMKDRFHRAPRELRRRDGRSSSSSEFIQLSLPYRPPLDWPHLLNYYRRHQMVGIEDFGELSYERVFGIGETIGVFRVSPGDRSHSALKLEIHCRETRYLFQIVQSVRRMFDLDSDPVLIANAFAPSRRMARLIQRFPGVRVPRGWDPFEAAILAILGQLVSVDRARHLLHEVITHYGTRIRHPISGEPAFLFPTAARLAKGSLLDVKTTGARRRTLLEFSRRVAQGKIVLDSAQDPAVFREQLLDIPGIGPWTAETMCLRSIGDTDAFPGTDLILKRALAKMPHHEIAAMTPWRGYAAMMLWRDYVTPLPKKKKRRS